MDYAREGTIFAVALAGAAMQHALLRSKLVKGIPLSDAQIKERAEGGCAGEAGKSYAQCLADETAYQKSLSQRSPTLSMARVVGVNALSFGTVFVPLFGTYMSFDFAAKKSTKTAVISAAVFAAVMLVIFNVIAATRMRPGVAGAVVKSIAFAFSAAAVSALMHEMWKKQ